MANNLNNSTRILALTLLLGALSLLVTSCGSGIRTQSVTTQTPLPNAAPAIASFSPGFIVAGSQATTLTIAGSGFETGTNVLFGTQAHTVTYISPQSITIQLDASELTAPSNITVTATNGSPGCGTSSTTFPIWQTAPDPMTGISIAMPPFNGNLSLSSNTSATGVIQLYPAITQPGSSSSASSFFLEVLPNPKNLSLQQWFEATVDANGTLLSSGAYQSSTLADGRAVLVAQTGAPPAYYAAGGDADFYYAYTQLPTGQIAAIQRSWEDDLYQQGLLSLSMSHTDLELSVLSTVRY